MEPVILICCIASVIISTYGVIKSKKPDNSEVEKKLDVMSQTSNNQSNMLSNQLNQQNETLVNGMTTLGKELRESQDMQQRKAGDQLDKINAEMKELRKDNQQTLDKLREETLTMLENMRKTNLDSIEHLRTDNQKSLDKINDTVNEKLQKTLDDKISKSFEAVNKRLAEVYEGLGEMKKVASGVTDLKNVLSNVKTRGIMGEIQLSAILSEILAPEQFGEQVTLTPNGSEKVDFAVKLPGAADGESVYLPIDSKFPGDTYSNLMTAYEGGNVDEIKAKRALLVGEIKKCAKSIHDKYIVPPYTTDFAIMFLPFEGLYAEVVNMGLVEELQKNYKINIAGPSTMAAMLNSLQMGFRTLAIQKKSGEVWKILEAAKKEFSTFGEVLNKTRNRIRQADEELDKLIGVRTRAINRRLSSVTALDSDEETEKLLEI